NGLVTTATVSAPISLASDAIIGAAPAPVPPPRPVVTNTISAPSSASIILSASSSAPRRPISGLAPAPSPLVSLVPNWIFTGARDICNACKSVLATTNSTPSMPEQIIRFTALPPPPPTPITLILALLRGSSLKLIRISPSGCICLLSSLMHHTPDPLSGPSPEPEHGLPHPGSSLQSQKPAATSGTAFFFTHPALRTGCAPSRQNLPAGSSLPLSCDGHTW